MTKKLLIVTDGKAGHENQSKAFCNALGYDYDCIRASYATPLHKALSYPLDRLGLLTNFPCRVEKIEGFYHAVVCTGSTAFYPGKLMARRRGIPVVAILFPSGYRKYNFDCILAPHFDHPPDYPNIIPLPVNLSNTQQDFYDRGVAEFHKRHRAQKPAIGVVLGGPNKVATLDATQIKAQLDQIFALHPAHELWVTTSRRTPASVEKLLDDYPFTYKLIFSRDHFNPLPAFITLCERLFVSADSTGMLSEAVTRGRAQVEVLMNLKTSNTKFARFIAGLVEQNAAHIFDGTLGQAAHKIDLTPIFEQARRMLRL